MQRYLLAAVNIVFCRALLVSLLLCWFVRPTHAVGAKLQMQSVVEVFAVVPASVVELSSSSLYMRVGEHKMLTATVLPTTCTNREVIWTTANASIARVDEHGTVKADRIGVTKVIATSGDGMASAECKVVVAPAYSVQECIFEDVMIGPNPFAGLLRITNDEFRYGTYELVNSHGLIVRSCKIEDRITEIDTNDLARGAYLLIVTNEELQTTETVRIIKN